MRRPDPFLLPLLAATITLFWVVPGLSFAHLTDPGYWGMTGYLLVLLLVLRLRSRGIRGSRIERRWLAIFLAGMPLVYLAYWWRFGSELDWLRVEFAGALPFWVFALWGLKRSPWFLVIGIAVHASWDLWHYRLTDFVADWYTIACFLVDVAFAIYAAGQVRAWQRRDLSTRSPAT